MQVTIDMLDGSPIPKRGDLLQSNIGDRRERTWMILSSRPVKPVKDVPRAKVWAARWWSIEPEMRMALWRSAERRGGQRVIEFRRYPAKRKPTLDDYLMRRS